MENEENQNRIYGPILPSDIKINSKETKITEKCLSPKNSDSPEYFGPQLPPHLLQQKQQKLQEEKDKRENQNDSSSNEDEKDESIVGPIPTNRASNAQQRKLDERALEIKIKNLDDASTSTGKDEKSREEWMTELPGLNKSGLGIFARQFRKREGPDMTDRSIWTDTPNSTKKPKQTTETKVSRKEYEKTEYDYEKDKEKDQIIKRHKKKHKRDKSLMEIHAKKLKKEKKKKDKTNEERRPFNREEDLQVNRFDQARKQAIIKKAQQLDTKFSSGKSKYL